MWPGYEARLLIGYYMYLQACVRHWYSESRKKADANHGHDCLQEEEVCNQGLKDYMKTICSERCSFSPQDSSCRETEVRTTHIKPQTLSSAQGYKVKLNVHVCVCFSCPQSSVPGRPAECKAEQYDACVEHLQWKDDRNNGKYPLSGTRLG